MRSRLSFVPRLTFLFALAACHATDPVAAGESATQPSVTGGVAGARITQRSESARVLELLDAEGRVLATYYPGFFNVSVIVPDIDTGQPTSRSVAGTWFLGAAFDATTGRVAVAVRGFIYAETSFDLVYVIDTRASGFNADPYVGLAFTSLPYDGRRGDGSLPAGATRPWLDIVPDSVSFDAVGRLHLQTAGADGSLAELAYAPDLVVDTCVWHYAGSAARCPDPTRN